MGVCVVLVEAGGDQGQFDEASDPLGLVQQQS